MNLEVGDRIHAVRERTDGFSIRDAGAYSRVRSALFVVLLIGDVHEAGDMASPLVGIAFAYLGIRMLRAKDAPLASRPSA